MNHATMQSALQGSHCLAQNKFQDFKLYTFGYNYSSVKPQEGGLTVALLGTPLLADPVDTP